MERAARIAVLAVAAALLFPGTRAGAAAQQPVRITPRPIHTGLPSARIEERSSKPIPVRVTPIPFTDDESFVLTLPEIYASSKPFAITIPKLGITDVSVSHPDDSSSQQGVLEPLREGLGHLFARPGQRGKIMIYGHSSGYPWDVSEFTRTFRRINALESGDRVYVTFEGRLFVYEVTHGEIVTADDTRPFRDDGTSTLALYTCWPPDTTDSRLIKYAKPIETITLRS